MGKSNMRCEATRPRHFSSFLDFFFLFGPTQDIQKTVAGVAVGVDFQGLLPRLLDLGRVLLREDAVEPVGSLVKLPRHV